jgi:hypothetical protein
MSRTKILLIAAISALALSSPSMGATGAIIQPPTCSASSSSGTTTLECFGTVSGLALGRAHVEMTVAYLCVLNQYHSFPSTATVSADLVSEDGNLAFDLVASSNPCGHAEVPVAQSATITVTQNGAVVATLVVPLA